MFDMWPVADLPMGGEPALRWMRGDGNGASGPRIQWLFSRTFEMQSEAWLVEGAVPSPLVGHAVNPSMQAQ
ncbi:hypothetical protein [Xanthomonas campestris]|nr:hypothetical protein [Xanthomonas campestris]